MRAAVVILVPWVVWGALDALIYMGLLAARPDSFDENGIPIAFGMQLFLLLLRAMYSLIAGFLAAKLAKKSWSWLPLAAIGLLFVTGLTVQLMNNAAYPFWFDLSFLTLVVVFGLFGATLGGAISSTRSKAVAVSESEEAESEPEAAVSR